MRIKIPLLIVALVLGFSSSSYAAHCVVQKGDSMWKIAKRYNVSFTEVLRLNSHYPDKHLIHPGDKIELPDGSTGAGTNTHSNSDNAAGQRSADEVMQSWMNSSGHRANILNSSYTELGVGYVKGGSYGTEWVQLFIGK